MKKLTLAICLQALFFTGQVYATESIDSAYIDPRFGRAKGSLYELLNARPGPEVLFWLKDSIFNLKTISDPDQVQKAFLSNHANLKAPTDLSKLGRDSSEYVDINTLSLISYLLKDYYADGKTYSISVVVDTDKKRTSHGYDRLYESGTCKGYGYIEAAIKKKCPLPEGTTDGLIEINYDRLLGLSRSKFQLKQIPEIGINESYSAKLLGGIANILGFRSNLVNGEFKAPLSNFDKALFSDNNISYLKEGTKLASLSKEDKCSKHKDFKDCNLYFLGANTRSLYNSSANTSELAYSSGVASDYFKLGVVFDNNGNPYLKLRNTVLSDSTFVNYGFYTLAELNVLKDLGYNINTKEFIGNSVYQSGSKEKRREYHFNKGFYAWSDVLHDYKNDQVSKVPASIGTHVYGSYNDVYQEDNIASIGFSSVGIRVDGSENEITIPKNVAIIENGINSAGVAFTYGRDNILNIAGRVEANSDDGVALRFDFGSNALSDMTEYQGSYRRVRTYDYSMKGLLDKKTAQSVNAPMEIRGPLVKEVNIKGRLAGKKYAIFIDESAHVQKINFYNKAKVEGNIVSYWEPYFDKKTNSFYATSQNTALLDGKLQFDFADGFDVYRQRNKLSSTLKTKINFGVKELLSKSKVKALSHEFDNKANINIEGNIVGKSFDLSSFGGHTHIKGYIDVNRLYVGNSVVDLATTDGNINYVNELTLIKAGQLDFSNGHKDKIVVRKKATISANSVICLDIDKDANLIDSIEFAGKLDAKDGVVNLEPGLSYPDIKAFQSDPKALYRILNTFVKNANDALRDYGVTTNFPKHVWYMQGDLGRQVKCTARGCYLTDFVNNYAKSQEELPYWRYILSFAGCALMLLLCFIFIRKSIGGRYG